MTRHWPAALLASAACLFATAPAAHAAVDRSDAVKKALAALDAREGDEALTVFGLRKTVAAGTRVTQAGPAGAPIALRGSRISTRLARAGVTGIAAGRVMTAGEASWLFYADEGPSLAFEHPGRVVLVGASSGRVTVSRRLRWVPLVNGRLPAFFATHTSYRSAAYRVFNRPWKARARAANAKARAAASTPENAAAQQRLADALAAERSCVLRVSDTLGDFYDFGRVDKTRASLGRIFKNLSQLNAGFPSERYATRAGSTPVQSAQQLIDAGCRDIFLYAAGSARRTGQAGIVVGVRPRGTRAIQWHTLTAAAIERLVRANRGVTFKFVFDAPFSGRMAQRLSDESNVSVLLTSGGADEPSFTYLPEVMDGSGVIRNTANPFGLLEFTSGVISGLERFVLDPSEIDHAIAEQAAGRSDSVLAWMLARSMNLGPSPFSSFLLGRRDQRVPFSSSSRTPPGAPANRAPSPTTPTTITTAEDTPRAVTLTGTDPDGDPLTFAVTAQPAHGTFSGVAPNLTYTPDQDFNGNDTFTYRVSDNRGGSAGETITLRVTPDNDSAAVVGGPALTPPVFTEDGAAVVIDNGLTVTDVDSTSLVSGTVEIVSGFVGSADELVFVDQLGISGTYDSGTGVLTLTGTASLADYQAALRSVEFDSTAQDPGPSRTIRFRVFDGDEIGVPADRGVAITEVNDAPVNTVPGAQSTNEDTMLTLTGATALSVADADARSDAIEATLTASNGTLTLADVTGLTFTTGDGSGDATMTFTGSQDDINDAIDVVQFIPAANYNGTGGQIQLVTDDQGNNGTGGAQSDTDNVPVTVTAVNDAPVNTLPAAGALDASEDGSATATAFSIADVDAGTGAMEVELSVLNGTVDVAPGGTLTGDDTATVKIEGTLAQINTSLSSVTYEPSANFNGGDTLTMETSDLGNTPAPAATDTDARSIAIAAVNDAPVLSLPAAPATTEDTPLAFTGGDSVSVTDVDVASGNLDVDLTISAGELSVDTLTLPVGVVLSGNGSTALSLTGTQPDVTTALGTLVWTPPANDGTSRTLSVVASDLGNTGAGGAQTDSDNVLITVTPVNDAPVVTTTGGTMPFTEGGSPVLVDSLLTVSDVESDTISGATAQVISGYANVAGPADHDALSCTPDHGITCASYDATTGTLTLTGTASVADYQDVLRSVTFSNDSQNSSASTRTVRFTVTDTGSTPQNGTGDRNVSVTRVNDAPVHDTPGAQTTDEDTPETLTGLGVSDVDAGTSPLQTTVTATNGTATLASTTGLTFTAGDGAADATMTFTGTQSAIDTALDGLQFTPTSNFFGPAAVQIVTSDQGATGTGGAQSDDDTVAITVGSVNDAPAVDTSAGSAAFTELGAAVAIDPGIAVTDGDDANLESATVSISAGHQTTDELAMPASSPLTDGVTPVYDSGTGVLTLTGTKTVAQYEAILRTVTFDSTSTSPGATRTVAFRVNDGDANSPATNHTRDIAITNTNDAPAIANLGGTVAYAENDPAVAIDTDATVTDTDSANLTGGTVQITGNFQPGDELSSTQHGNVTGSFDGSTGLLTITGTDTVAQYQAFVRDVKFRTTDETPDTGDRTVSFQVQDGQPTNSLSNIATKTVTVAATNDAPVVTTTGGSSSYTEDQSSPTVVDNGVTVSDADHTALSSATVAIANYVSGEDLLHFTDTAEIDGTFTAGTLTLIPVGGQTPDVADFQAALRSVAYSNTSQNPTTTARTINVNAHDGVSSSNTASKTMTVAGVNDSPALTQPDAAALTYTEDTPSENHTAAIAPSLTVADGDDASLAGATVQLTAGFASTQDELVFVNQNGITGTYNTGTGVLTLIGTSTVANYQTALRSIAYRNTSENPSETQRSVSFQVSDGHAGQSPDSNTVTRNIDVVRKNDAPTPDADTFSGANEAVGNTSYVVNDATDGAPNPAGPQKTVTGDLLDGDTDPDNAPGDLNVRAETKATADGGSITFEEDGDFTYHPPAGCDGGATDTVQYTVEDNHPSDEQAGSATLTIHIAQCVWYVDDSAAAGGDGRSHTPYNALTALNTSASDVDVAGERIFLYAGTYSGGLTLENSQPLHTEKHGLTVGDGNAGNLVLEAANSGASTTLGGGLVLADGNSVQGLNLGNHAGPALSGTAVGNASVNDLTSGALANTTGGAVDISGGTLSVAFSSLSSSNSSADAIRLDNTTGTFTAAGGSLASAAGQTVDISGNDAGDNLNFTYDGTIADDAGQLVSITDQTGGTKTFNGPVNDVTSTPDNGGGIAVTSNATSNTVDFNGDVDLSTGPTTALTITGPSTVSLDNSGSSIATTSGTGVDISGAAAQNIPIDATINTATGRLVEVENRSGGLVEFKRNVTDSGNSLGILVNANTGGDVLFSGASKEIDTVSTNHGVNVTSNTGATVRFENGGLDVATAAGRAFRAVGGGTVEVSGTGNILSSGGGGALEVANTTISGDDLTFQSLTSNGAANGVSVSNTVNAAGKLIVSGNGGTCTSAGTCTGGAIQNSTATGVLLSSVPGGVSFTRLHVNNSGDDGINGTGVTDFNLDFSRVASNGNGVADDGVEMSQLAGTASFNTTTVTSNSHNNVTIANTSGNLTATFNGGEYSQTNVHSTSGADAILLRNDQTGTMTATIQNATFTNNRDDHVQVAADADSAATLNVTVQTNTMTNTVGQQGNGITANPGGTSTTELVINDNDIVGSNQAAITVDGPGSAVSPQPVNIDASITNNTIGTAATSRSGAFSGVGIAVNSNGGADIDTLIQNNDVRQYSNPEGISLIQNDGVGSLNATVRSNIVTNQAGTIDNLYGVRAIYGSTAADTGTGCLDLGGAGALSNNLTGSSPAASDDIRVRQGGPTTLQLPGYAGGPTDTAAVAAYLLGRNTAPNGADVTRPNASSSYATVASCPLP